MFLEQSEAEFVIESTLSINIYQIRASIQLIIFVSLLIHQLPYGTEHKKKTTGPSRAQEARVQQMQAPAEDMHVQNVKMVADKMRWKVEYRDQVLDGRFQSMLTLTPKWQDTIELAWSEGYGTKSAARRAAALIGLKYFEQQPLTLVLGQRFHANREIMDTGP